MCSRLAARDAIEVQVVDAAWRRATEVGLGGASFLWWGTGSDALSQLAQLDVQPLRCPAQDVEGLLRAHILLSHEDALRLTDDVTTLERLLHLLVLLSAGESHRRM